MNPRERQEQHAQRADQRGAGPGKVAERRRERDRRAEGAPDAHHLQPHRERRHQRADDACCKICCTMMPGASREEHQEDHRGHRADHQIDEADDDRRAPERRLHSFDQLPGFVHDVADGEVVAPCDGVLKRRRQRAGGGSHVQLGPRRLVRIRCVGCSHGRPPEPQCTRGRGRPASAEVALLAGPVVPVGLLEHLLVLGRELRPVDVQRQLDEVAGEVERHLVVVRRPGCRCRRRCRSSRPTP